MDYQGNKSDLASLIIPDTSYGSCGTPSTQPSPSSVGPPESAPWLRQKTPHFPGDTANGRLLRESTKRFQPVTSDPMKTMQTITALVVVELKEAQSGALELLKQAKLPEPAEGTDSPGKVITTATGSWRAPIIGVDAASHRVESLSNKIDAMCKNVQADLQAPAVGQPVVLHRQGSYRSTLKDAKLPEDVKRMSMTPKVLTSPLADVSRQPLIPSATAVMVSERHRSPNLCTRADSSLQEEVRYDKRLSESTSAYEISAQSGVPAGPASNQCFIPDNYPNRGRLMSVSSATGLGGSLVNMRHHGHQLADPRRLSSRYDAMSAGSKRISQSGSFVGLAYGGAGAGSVLGNCRTKITPELAPAVEESLVNCARAYGETWLTYYTDLCELLGAEKLFLPSSESGEERQGQSSILEDVLSAGENSSQSSSELSSVPTSMSSSPPPMLVAEETFSLVQYQMGHASRLLAPFVPVQPKATAATPKVFTGCTELPSGVGPLARVPGAHSSSTTSVAKFRPRKPVMCCLAFVVVFVIAAVIGAGVATAIIYGV